MLRARVNDNLEPNERPIDGLEDGTRLFEIDQDGGGLTYRIETADGDRITLDEKRRARLWVDVYALAGGFERPKTPDAAIPLPVVLEGNAAVATYLYAARGWSTERIADELDVEKRTVWDYLSRTRRRAREQDDFLE